MPINSPAGIPRAAARLKMVDRGGPFVRALKGVDMAALGFGQFRQFILSECPPEP